MTTTRPVATIVVVGALVLFGCDTAANVAGLDPASLATDRLFEVFNAQDAEEIATIFGDDVAFTLESGEDVVGAEAATFWQGYLGRETGERITDAFHAADGRTYFLAEFTRSSGASSTLVFDVEMDGERLVRMGARPRNLVEVIATGQVDDLHEAFNDQDLERLTEEFEGMTYRSPTGADYTGAEAAEHWAEAFGSSVTRTTGVFALGDSAAGFVTVRTEPDSALSTEYAVEVEVSGGHVASMTERRLKP